MAMDMYQSMVGWSEYKENDKKHNPTHKLLTNEVYEDLQNQIEKLNKAIKKKDYDINAERKKIITDAITQKQELDEEYQEKWKEAEEKILAAEAERDYQKGLNINLLRINKERSNADRKLQPKREHSGYLILQSHEKEIRYPVKKRTESVTVWETIIQSPYTVDFTEENAREQIERELLVEGLVNDIGITYKYFDTIEKVKNEVAEHENTVFQRHLRANFKAGYWEIVILHTKALGPVPKSMRA